MEEGSTLAHICSIAKVRKGIYALHKVYYNLPCRKPTCKTFASFLHKGNLSKALDYSDFRNFTGVIERVIEACKNSGNNHLYHLVEANEMV